MKEFKDTLKYIASIWSGAEPYGICRIVPPTSWKPPCSLEKKDLWEAFEFVAHIQRIDGIQVQQETVASSCENTKTKRRRCKEVALDSQLGNATSTCAKNDLDSEDCMSEPGPKFSLNTFKKFADEFKIQYFNYKGKNKIMGSGVTVVIKQNEWEPSVEIIEGEYGRIAQNPTEEIEVLCGNTSEAGGFSSGFPTVSDTLEEHAYPEYLKSGWNLNNIHSLPGSLLSFESSAALHNFSPRVHVGMCFSPHDWNVEEHQLYSLSYIHFGEPKVWYSVPGRYAVNFEAITKKYLSRLYEKQPDVDDNLMMQLSCSILKAEGIPVYRCVQYPREFVLIFPGAYHSGFDCGFNCSESVSFAPLEWLLHGQNDVELYCEQRRKMLISYDKLLLGAAREAVRTRWETDLCMKSTPDKLTSKDAYHRNGILAKVLGSCIRSESIKREYLCNSLKSKRMDRAFDATCKRECRICLRDIHLSAVGCPCSEEKFACLNHAKQLCPCTWSSKTLLYRYEISELNLLCQALEGKLSAVYKWAKEDLGLSLLSVAKRCSTQNPPENTGRSSPPPLEDSKMKDTTMSQSVLDMYSKWKQQKSQVSSDASETKQNEVAFQARGPWRGNCISSFSIQPKEKTISDNMKAKEKAASNSTISNKEKGGDQKVSSTVSSVTNSRFLSFLQENTLIEVSSDGSTSSSESDCT